MGLVGFFDKEFVGFGSLLIGLICFVIEGYVLEYRDGREKSVRKGGNFDKIFLELNKYIY